ncbi:amino acid ABC transporter permease [Actinomyces gaoshouyii]|uniref:Amino acid ABC transporter permease n=1 Tax=Actinomyces gaoshouyii TaxID=1960083 RepID=A0A8H9H9Z3_9ACTO|nr:amino acid ABC transporter permease [Actinomyces gaoshouyii]ARD41539.1 ABC transporter permease [Actinomyces gaoshouyii]GGP00054.1 amino acid ABC transporter permease [Actinomyces gaoshouyii]
MTALTAITGRLADRAPDSRRGRAAGDAALLFDAPGPRGRVRILIVSLVVAVLLIAIVVAGLHQLSSAGQLDYVKWRYFLGQSIVNYLGEAILKTLRAAGIAAVLSFPIGIALGWARMARSTALRGAVGLWIDAMRAIPMLLLVYFFLLAVPRWGPTLPSMWMLVVPIVMCTSATTAEVFRSGVRSLDAGQSEAAVALGLSSGQTMRLVLAPQALRLMLPTLITQMVTILKDTSLGYVVAYGELMHATKVLTNAAGFDVYLPAYVVVALIYVVINWLLSAAARRIEARSR